MAIRSNKPGRPKGTKIDSLDIERAQEYPKKLWDKSARIVAAELENHIRNNSIRPNPTGKNPSKGGEYPKAVTTKFVGGVRVIYAPSANSFRVYSLMPYGKYLQDGTTNPDGSTRMEARPWATKALEARDWIQRVAIIAREASKK